MQRAADSGRYDDGTGEKIGKQLYNSRSCDCITVFLVYNRGYFVYSKEQLGDLILESQHQMYATAKSILKDDHDCADAIQETIVKAFAKLDTLQKDRYAKTWIMRILMNECYNICRKNEKILPIDQYMDCIETPQRNETDYGDLYEAVCELCEELRIPVVLYYVEDFSCREIAEILGISEGAVQKRLARARGKLKNQLEDKEAAGR